ncbi:ParB/RepB/Spo0J family partition protein [Komagataeibacter medellinensis]|uniref:Chromosome partitioning nuclease protein n=1 Tax=Komagataeibacter medellinensis (strain NBRC 3288 / BCRC 11682 / LMG 1693 / Kondo 51) TaxID=634177 RepID=G2I0W4_KOMMN|nr:ParB/RepB/Spo0J family partition protein [Komagataeibacter medellinensis]BAK84572.1 chromosome partitioning nuclease protein [Komagataeibacter medellinensis NBRC 3288]
MMVAIADIHENGNMRRVQPTAEVTAALEGSIRALGVLQPVVVRPDPEGGYILIAGYRRLNAARSVGLTEIPAVTHLLSEVEAEAAQAAENIQRVPVDPVDQWRHIERMVADGYTVRKAGLALGMTDRQIGQICKLGGLAPEVLDALTGRELPSWRILGEISQAAHEVQAAALKRHLYHGDAVQWNSVAGECITRRIPRERALFDVEASGIVFDEDLFAEPGSPEQFTTTDTAGFMAAQRGAVEDLIQTGDEPALLVDYNATTLLPQVPAGWMFADSSGGADKTLTRRSRHKRAYAIVPLNHYHDACSVVSVIIKPVKATAAVVADDQADDVVEEPDSDPGAIEVVETDDTPAEEPQITKAGQDYLAEIRTNALRSALRNPLRMTPEDAFHALLIAYVAGNSQMRDILAALVSPAGDLPELEFTRMAELAGEALARTLTVVAPHRQTSPWKPPEEYARPEYIGALINADAQMPELDTAEMLAHVSGSTLKAIAKDYAPRGEKAPAKVTDLRQWLVGRAPDWCPVHFGVPGPRCEPWVRNADRKGEAA